MKKQFKTFLVVLVFTAFFTIVVAVWYTSRKGVTYETTVRPENFPKILVAPKGSVIKRYSTTSNTQRASHIYGLDFTVHENFPPEGTLNLIREHLIANGWQRLEYDLMNPYNRRLAPPNSLPEYLTAEQLNFLQEGRKRKKGYSALTYIQEDWISKNDEWISVIVVYALDLATGKVDSDKAAVDMSLFERDSWIRPWITRYKEECHPEEFGETANTNQRNEQKQ